MNVVAPRSVIDDDTRRRPSTSGSHAAAPAVEQRRDAACRCLPARATGPSSCAERVDDDRARRRARAAGGAVACSDAEQPPAPAAQHARRARGSAPRRPRPRRRATRRRASSPVRSSGPSASTSGISSGSSDHAIARPSIARLRRAPRPPGSGSRRSAARDASSSRCVPVATMRPSSSSAARSASAIVDGRCTTTSAVRSARIGRKRLLDARFGVHVERRERIVEHEHAWPPDDGARDREPLTLAARQRQPLFADAGVETPRQVVRERRPARRRAPSRCRRRSRRGGRSAGSRARSPRTASAPRTRTRPAPRRLRSDDVAEVVSVEADRPGRRVVEAREQRRDRGLAGAGRADERERLAGMDLEIDAVQHRPVGTGIGEVHVLEADLAPCVRQRAALRADRRSRARCRTPPTRGRPPSRLPRPSRGSNPAPRSATRGSGRTRRTRRGRRR